MYYRNSWLKSVFRFCSSREQLQYDVCIVGAGPAGLSAAIRLKQLAQEQGKYDPTVIVIEKASSIGGHILSGNCFQATALNELFPGWPSMKENRPPVNTRVSEDRFYFLWDQNKSFQIPNFLYPNQIRNHNNYVISLGELCQWMADRAQEMGVDVFPGTAGAGVLYDSQGAVKGIYTGDMGIDKKGKKKPNYTPGIDILAKQVIFAEGARGSLSEQVMKKYELRKDCDPQSYGLGLKEIWEVPQENFEPGLVQHTVGWPLDRNTYGGSFMYHIGKNHIHFGMVVGLDYSNPTLYPYEEFQLLKQHPVIKRMLLGGQCISYGARTLNEGGYYSIPKLTFPGGVLAGCSAGFLDVMKIKGAHNAMKSGMVAAETIYEYLDNCEGRELKEYEEQLKKTWVIRDLYQTRNFKGAFKQNVYTGLFYGALNSLVTRGKEPWSFRVHKKDSETYTPIQELKKEQIKTYPKHDGVLTFDLLENLQRSGTTHEHDQPSHLQVVKEDGPQESLLKYGAPEERFCPAKVYEFVDDSQGGKKLQINAQNCLHCKTCDLKMPKDYINWNVPEGGGGPNYTGM